MTRCLGPSMGTAFTRALVATCCLLAPTQAQAQTRTVVFRGFGDVGASTFTAEQSFKAILGSRSGMVFGGGVEAVLPQRIFVAIRASHFRKTGERVSIVNGAQFGLGIPTTITLTPVEMTGGFRFDVASRLVPYAGAGVGWHRFRESSEFAEDNENVDKRFTGFHVIGGAEFRLLRWIGAAGEVQWATVPDAIGDDPNSVSHEFNESDLGGVTLRVKVVVGR